MSTNYPSGTDSLTNPAGTSLLTSPDHAAQHTNINDGMEAVQSNLGTNSGTFILKHFVAGNFPVRVTGVSAIGTLQQTVAGGTIGTSTFLGGVITGTPTLDANSIPGSALTTSAVFLAYGTATAVGTVGVGTTTLCSGTFTMPSGGRRVEVTGWIPQVYSTAGDARADVRLLENGTELATSYGLAPTSTGGIGGVTVLAFLSPSVGAHTYSLGLSRGNGTSVVSAYSDSVNSIKLIVKLI
jgi:hypothetical protein